MIAALQGLGIKVAIDDVGAGHAGLSYMLKLGVDIIKIDKMFIDALGHDNSSMTIIETLVDLARNMRMESSPRASRLSSRWWPCANAASARRRALCSRRRCRVLLSLNCWQAIDPQTGSAVPNVDRSNGLIALSPRTAVA